MPYILINENRQQVKAFLLPQSIETIEVDCIAPSENHILKKNYNDFKNEEQWEVDTKKQIELLKTELETLVTEKKKEIAYGGYKFIKADQEYCFSTSKEDMGLISSVAMRFEYNVITSINCKCKDNKYVELNKLEFLTLCKDSSTFVGEQFTKEKAFLDELNSIDLTDEFVTDFKRRVKEW